MQDPSDLPYPGEATDPTTDPINLPCSEEATDSPPTQGESEGGSVSHFITCFKEVVERDMNLSRVQLYRKVKAVTGSSPVELLRTARLNRAYQLLITTDKSVSEIAYDVGFTAPSYFTKCFKETYGMLPGDARKQ